MCNLNSKLTAIVSAHNPSNFTERYLYTLPRHSYTNLDVVLFDNKSTGDSLEICRQYENNDPKVDRMRQRSVSAPRASNGILKEATRKYTAISDSDERIESTKIEKLLKTPFRLTLTLAYEGVINYEKS